MTTDPFVHSALFYRGAEEYLAGTLPFVTEGLADGGAVAVAVPTPQLDLLRSSLGTVTGHVEMIDMTDQGRNPGQIIPGVLRAFADRYEAPVRIVSEPLWPSRQAVEYPACAQHEALINYAFGRRPVSILCPYDTAGLQGQAIADAMRTHPSLTNSNGTRTSAEYAPDSVLADYNEPLTPPPSAECRLIDVTSLSEVRHFITKVATQAGLDNRVDDLVLAVDELAANSVRHGGGTGMVSVWTEDRTVVCQVDDSGFLSNPLAGRIPAPALQIGGRGLLMVNHLADLVRTHTCPDGTAIRIHFTLAAPVGD